MAERLFARLKHLVDLRIPGFERAVPAGRVRQLALEETASRLWFDEFVDRLTAAVGKQHLPLYRMGDGEFNFAVGFRMPYPARGANPVIHYARQVLSYLKWRKFDTLWSGKPDYGYEVYRGQEWRELRHHYVQCLQEIARDGILALALFKTPERFAEQYHRPICDWFDEHGIRLDQDNYYPVYFVSGLLNGPLRGRLLGNRRVLVVTSFDADRKRALTDGLLAAGVASVQFIPISRTGALKDRIDLSRLERPIDLVLIGGGIGAANILVQLRELNTLCIDAGFCLDLIAQPELAGTRDFTLSDEPALDRDGGRMRFQPGGSRGNPVTARDGSGSTKA